MLLVTLYTSDLKYVEGTISAKSSTSFGTNIYSVQHKLNTLLTRKMKISTSTNISKINNGMLKIPYPSELNRVDNIAYNIGDFVASIPDWSNTNLDSLKTTNYQKFINEMKQISKAQ